MSEKELLEPQNEHQLDIVWHALDSEKVLEELKVPIDTGLTTEEVERRLKEFGPNALQERAGTTFWQRLWAQINSFVIWLLIGAAVISGITAIIEKSFPTEMIAIMAIVILNAIMGMIQESRAEASLAALKKMASPEAHVLRDGHRQTVPAPELVPGDIVFVEAGYFIPADIRLLEAVNLSVEEASLTGESVPAKKTAEARLEKDIPLGDRENSAFMGTTVTYGRGKGVVTSTGMHTQLGLIATMLQAVEDEETPLQKRLDQLGKTLGIAAIIICILVFLVSAARLIFMHEVELGG
ncbi:MAG TPA: HAD-IC family P-type ATPase, partial [Anaerolineaceae bacterium]|nr:HAD-IC family P-type ATPase [Anaerolineaceae bacterium]